MKQPYTNLNRKFLNVQLLNIIIIICSDRAASGERADKTIPMVQAWCDVNGYKIISSRIVSDEPGQIKDAILEASASKQCDMIVTSGGTGLADRDNTPECTAALVEKQAPGIAEYLRSESMKKTPFAALSRGIAGIINRKLIINLPGNPDAVIENLEWLKKIVPHAIRVLKGHVGDSEHMAK